MNTCGTCKHFVKDTKNFDKSGTCRRHPPQIIGTIAKTPTGQVTPISFSVYPPVKMDWLACGEYKETEIEKPAEDT